eukprot:1392368-Amorphochlora_amoeboformis.AAC.1
MPSFCDTYTLASLSLRDTKINPEVTKHEYGFYVANNKAKMGKKTFTVGQSRVYNVDGKSKRSSHVREGALITPRSRRRTPGLRPRRRSHKKNHLLPSSMSMKRNYEFTSGSDTEES